MLYFEYKENTMWKVAIIESERGYGQKINEVKEFETYEEAEEFVKEFNAKNDLDYVPDWYMVAMDPVKA